MEMSEGSCRFGLWHVHVYWSGHMLHRVRFSHYPCPGRAPVQFTRFLAGQGFSLAPYSSVAAMGEGLYPQIYRAVMGIEYGTTASYGAIAALVGTGPRVVGQAMARNPTPLAIPCHRIVGKHGLGGFTPSPEIKEALLLMEKKQAGKRNGVRGEQDAE